MLKIVFYLCVFLLSLGQFTALSKNSGYNLYFFDFLVILFVLLGTGIFLWKKSFKIPAPAFLFVLFSFYLLVGLLRVFPLYDFSENLVSLFYLVRFVFYLGAGIILFNMLTQKLITMPEVLNALVFSGVLVSFMGFIQLLVLPDLSLLDSSLGWDPHKNRLVGPFFDPNFTGAYLVLGISTLLHQIYTAKQKITLVTILSFLVIFLGIFLTFSRSAWLMLGLVIFVWGIFKSRLLLVLFLVISFLAYFAVPRIQTRLSGLTDPADSAQFRLVSWGNTLRVVLDNQPFGVGYNTYRFIQKDYGIIDFDSIYSHASAGSDSSILFIFATSGVIGLGLYLLGFGYLLRKNASNPLVLSVILGLFCESWFINSLFYPQIMFWVFILGFNYYFLRT